MLVTHKSKAPSILGKQAKADGETGQFTFGTLSVKGKDLSLALEGKMPQGIDRKMKELLKAAGMPMKVNVIFPEDEEGGEDRKDAAAAETAPKEKPRQRWKKRKPKRKLLRQKTSHPSRSRPKPLLSKMQRPKRWTTTRQLRPKAPSRLGSSPRRRTSLRNLPRSAKT